MRVASLVEQAQAAHDRRSALYQSYEDAINKYKTTKDLTLFGTNRKKIDADHKTLSQQIGNIQSRLKTEGADASDKVSCHQLFVDSTRFIHFVILLIFYHVLSFYAALSSVLIT